MTTEERLEHIEAQLEELLNLVRELNLPKQAAHAIHPSIWNQPYYIQNHKAPTQQ